MGVVTPTGLVFEGSYGSLKAYETDKEKEKLDGDTMYKIASISKMFAALQTTILRERGLLGWYVIRNRALFDTLEPDESSLQG